MRYSLKMGLQVRDIYHLTSRIYRAELAQLKYEDSIRADTRSVGLPAIGLLGHAPNAQFWA